MIPFESSSHSWERLDRSWERSDFSWDPDDLEEFTRQEGEAAGEMFIDFLLTLHFSGHMSAKSLCVLSWWASRAGALGPAQKYAFRPDAPSGHYQRHVDLQNGVNIKEMKSKMLKVPVPKYSKHDAGRSVVEHPVQAPHDVLCQEIAEDPSILDKAKDIDWPPSFYDNEVYKNNKDKPVVPYCLYVDGVRTTVRDGVIGFWTYSLVTMKRFLVTLIRKSELCRCGCRGWCSLWPVFKMISWSFNAFSKMVFPTEDAFGRTFVKTEERRFDQAGKAMPCIGVLNQIRGDWAEFTATFGLANWATKDYPCFLCDATKATMHSYKGLSTDCFPFKLVTSDDYNKSCANCEHTVVLTKRQHGIVKSNLEYDKRAAGSRGRIVKVNLPEVGLLAKDRLEPSGFVTDVAVYESIDTFPTTTTWWRRSEETFSRHRNPVLSDTVGVNFETFALDLLHTLYQGVATDFCAACFWILIDNNQFGKGKSAEETLALSCLRIRHLLWSWYPDAQKRTPNLTRMEDFNPGTLGTRQKPTLHAKAAETKGVIPFCVLLIRERVGNLGDIGAALLRCGEGLVDMIEIMGAASRLLTDEQYQRLMDATMKMMRFWRLAGLGLKPKMHLLAHLIWRSNKSGNPRLHTTFSDESLNLNLADLSRAAHRMVFEYRVFAHFAELSSDRPSKAPRRL